MKLENQVVSLDLAKRLKELEVKQESLFYWAECCDNRLITADWHDQEMGEWGDCHTYASKPHVSAFTAAELGEMLPFSVVDDAHECTVEVYKDFKGNWEAWLEVAKSGWMSGEKIVADTEADARAKMLIYLLENRLIAI